MNVTQIRIYPQMRPFFVEKWKIFQIDFEGLFHLSMYSLPNKLQSFVEMSLEQKYVEGESSVITSQKSIFTNTYRIIYLRFAIYFYWWFCIIWIFFFYM